MNKKLLKYISTAELAMVIVIYYLFLYLIFGIYNFGKIAGVIEQKNVMAFVIFFGVALLYYRTNLKLSKILRTFCISIILIIYVILYLLTFKAYYIIFDLKNPFNDGKTLIFIILFTIFEVVISYLWGAVSGKLIEKNRRSK